MTTRLQHLIEDLVDGSRFQHGKLRLTLLAMDGGELVVKTCAVFALAVPQPLTVVEARSDDSLIIWEMRCGWSRS